jgi:gamma-glutamyltranspeptidase/glutathione hydrolase
MGYTITEQNNWGAAALIVTGPPSEAPDTRDAVPSDAAAGDRMRPGLFYGAMDSRRPAGLAIGE